jgi:hypothetical protein
VRDSSFSLGDRKPAGVDGPNNDRVVEQAIDQETLAEPQDAERPMAQRGIDPGLWQRRVTRRPGLQRDEPPVVLLDHVEQTLGACSEVTYRANVRQVDEADLLERAMDMSVAGNAARKLTRDEHVTTRSDGQTAG